MSKVVNLDFILKSAAKDLNMDLPTLQHLAYHQYQYMRRFHSDPKAAELKIHKFGSFEITRYKFYTLFANKILPYYRKNRTEKSLEVVRQCIKFRHILNDYYSKVFYKTNARYIDGLYERVKVKIGCNVSSGDIPG